MESSQKFEIMKKAVTAAVQKVCESSANTSLTSDPQDRIRPLIEYNSRMRLFPLEKFNGPCFIGAANFYLSNENMTKKALACGAVVVYLEEEAAGRVLKAIAGRRLDEEDREAMKEQCAAFCDLIAGEFKNGLVSQGAQGIVLSKAAAFYSTVPEGVDFAYSENQYVEVTFYLFKKKAIVVDTTLSQESFKG